MREIKFRVWDRKREILRDVRSISYFFNNPVFVVFEETDGYGLERVHAKDAPIMQYTGLKDSEGTEIYEGDVVEAYGGVEWNGIWEHKERCYIKDIRDIPLAVGESFEKIVIGNVYENPELLEVEQ